MKQNLFTILTPKQGSLHEPPVDFYTKVSALLTAHPCGIRCGCFLITREAAQEILDKYNHPRNRHKKPFHIRMMAEDQLGGFWQLTHQGIAFSDEGWLVDGQNRLESIVLSGVPVPMLVFFDVPSKSMAALDLVKTRSPGDGGHIMGLEVSRSHVAVVKRMIMGFRSHVPLSNQATLQFLEDHREAVTFAFQAFGGHEKGVTQAPVIAVVARAYYSQDRERLRAFGKVMKTGMPVKPAEDGAGIVLRNWLLRVQSQKAYGAAATISAYRKTERALLAFLQRENLDKIYEAASELFPLPGEDAANENSDDEQMKA